MWGKAIHTFKGRARNEGENPFTDHDFGKLGNDGASFSFADVIQKRQVKGKRTGNQIEGGKSIQKTYGFPIAAISCIMKLGKQE